MKKERNCGYMGPNIPMMAYQPMMVAQPNIGYNQPYSNGVDIASIEQRLNNLEARISKLENNNINKSYNKYNDSNYYML